MTELEKFKELYPKAEYYEETDTMEWYNEETDIVEKLQYARWHLENHYEGTEVLIGHFTDPDNTPEKLSGYDYIRFNGGYQTAYNDIN